MAIPKIKTADEIARLDAIYAEIEAAGFNADGVKQLLEAI